jgi:hypothetical protein
MSQPLPKYATVVGFERSTIDTAADRPILERIDLVLACAHVLHTNETVQAAERAGAQLGLRATMIAYGKSLSCGPQMATAVKFLSNAAVLLSAGRYNSRTGRA